MLTRWEPFRDMRRIHDMLDRVMDDSMGGTTQWYEGMAPIDVYQDDDEIVVEASLPGVAPEDVDISVTGDTLTLRGTTKLEREDNNGGSHRRYSVRERRYTSFARSITLPSSVNADKAQAEIENGILTLHIPKAEEAKPRQISVKARK